MDKEKTSYIRIRRIDIDWRKKELGSTCISIGGKRNLDLLVSNVTRSMQI
jgi:hypothetical protein